MKELRYTDDKSLPELVLTLADLKREGTYWDFKKEWHHCNSRLVHDIICMANNPDGTTGLLIIGIDQEADFSPTGGADLLGKRRNTQNLTDMLHKENWADGMPKVRVVAIDFDGNAVDVVLIDHDDEAVPYYLLEDSGAGRDTVRAGTIYSREADSNTPLNGSASALSVERLWRRHFGLDMTPLERLWQLLKDPAKWRHTLPVLARDEENCGYCYCHEDFPEFTYVRRPQEGWDRIDPFMLASPFFHGANWWTGYFYYHQTMLLRMDGAYSDHLWIPEPKPAALRPDGRWTNPDNAHYYGYFIEDSIEQIVMRFELDESKEGPSAAEEIGYLNKIVPVYQDEDERARFEAWVMGHWGEFLDRSAKQERGFRIPAKPTDREGCHANLERMAKESATLVEMLFKYRAEAKGLKVKSSRLGQLVCSRDW